MVTVACTGVPLNLEFGRVAIQVCFTPVLFAGDEIVTVISGHLPPAEAASSCEGTSVAITRLGSVQPARKAVLNKSGIKDDLIVFIIFGLLNVFVFAVMIRKSFAAAVSKI